MAPARAAPHAWCMTGSGNPRQHVATALIGGFVCVSLFGAGAAHAEPPSATDISGAWTNFLGVAVSGNAPKTPRIGGRLDAWATIDGRDLGLWEGLALKARPELVYGESLNGHGSGETLPINTALSFPVANAEAFDLSISVSQRIGTAQLTFGKINTVDLKMRTPIQGGSGIDGFQYLQFAAPITVFTPPAIMGALLSIPVGQASVTVGVWDPESAIRRTGFEHRLFRKGVNGMVSATLPVTIGGLQGWQNLNISGTTKRGIDFDTIPDLSLPPGTQPAVETRKGGWMVKYCFQQYLQQDAANPSGGWGVFGDLTVWDSNPTPLEWGMSLGIAGNPGIPSRPADRFGIAYYRFSIASDLVEAADPLLTLGAEQGVELFYTVQLARNIGLTANTQWLSSAQSDVPNALHTGLRLTTRF